VAVLVGRRLSDYARRVGLLKSVGGTPVLVAATFLAENLVLALFAAAVGLVIGWLASPLLTNPGAALIGAPGAPAISLTSAAVVVGLAIVVSLAATLLLAIRAARSSTVAALNDVARPPKRRGTLIRISTRLPVPTLFGLRLVTAGRAEGSSARRTSPLRSPVSSLCSRSTPTRTASSLRRRAA
jgi:predicted lysophospholipase L1 biosynthesis ABC-type transport system permease subunit